MIKSTIFKEVFMPVPAEIRGVARPVNTIVVDNGRDGPRRYAVRERAGIRYVPGGNPQPRNGKVIGHVDAVKLEFVPLKEKISISEPQQLSYGSSALVKSVSSDILSDLFHVYSIDDAYKIITIATLRIIKPSLPSRNLSREYKRTFVSKYYPGISLSSNSVYTFIENLGKDEGKRREFYKRRALSVISENHIAIDGMLKQDSSIVNDLSAFSYKARVRGCKEISVLYAYDIEKMEPICAEVFPGNCIDASSYAKFIRNNDIRKGIIIADKGFPPSMIENELQSRPELHYLTPIKRNDIRIKNNNMLDYDGVLEGTGKYIQYKKARIKGGRYLYSFNDSSRHNVEMETFLENSLKNNSYDKKKFQKKKDFFGVIVFESDQDLSPEAAYKCYQDRWLLELVFKHYKSDLGLDKTNVHNDFSVIGYEFINFISTILTCRILIKAQKANLLKNISYGDLIEDLSSIWRKTDAPSQPHSDDEYWIYTSKEVISEMEALGLSIPAIKPEPKRRGRPKKVQEVDGEKPRRPRGRPRKNSSPREL